jgi:hypothetical protein
MDYGRDQIRKAKTDQCQQHRQIMQAVTHDPPRFIGASRSRCSSSPALEFYSTLSTMRTPTMAALRSLALAAFILPKNTMFEMMYFPS